MWHFGEQEYMVVSLTNWYVNQVIITLSIWNISGKLVNKFSASGPCSDSDKCSPNDHNLFL
jgi:hypothetical protein